MVRIFGLHHNNRTSRAVVSMNKEASQIQESTRRHNCREVEDPEKLDWLFWLSQIWKWYFAVNRFSGLNSTHWLHQRSAEAHASGNREAFTNDDRWKTNRWTPSWWEKSRWKLNDEVWGFFLVSGFRTHVVATAVCATGCVHTLRVARAFFWRIFLSWRTNIAYTHGSRCLQCACHISPSHPLHSHVSSAVFAVPANCSRSESAGQAHFARAAGNLATWPIPCTPHQWQQVKNNLLSWGRQYDLGKKLRVRVQHRLQIQLLLWNILRAVRHKVGGYLKRSEPNDLVGVLTCLNALEEKFWKSNQKVVMVDESNQKVVMDEEWVQTDVMDEELVPERSDRWKIR